MPPLPPLKTLKMKLQSHVRVNIGFLGYAQFIQTIFSWLTCVFFVFPRNFKLKISLIVTFD